MKKLIYLGFISLMILGFSGCGSSLKFNQAESLSLSEYNKFPAKVKIQDNIECYQEPFRFNLKKNDVYALYDFSDKKLGGLTLPDYSIAFKVGETSISWIKHAVLDGHFNIYIFLNENGERLFDNYLMLPIGTPVSGDYDFFVMLPEKNGKCVDSSNHEIKNLKFEIIKD